MCIVQVQISFLFLFLNLLRTVSGVAASDMCVPVLSTLQVTGQSHRAVWHLFYMSTLYTCERVYTFVGVRLNGTLFGLYNRSHTAPQCKAFAPAVLLSAQLAPLLVAIRHDGSGFRFIWTKGRCFVGGVNSVSVSTHESVVIFKGRCRCLILSNWSVDVKGWRQTLTALRWAVHSQYTGSQSHWTVGSKHTWWRRVIVQANIPPGWRWSAMETAIDCEDAAVYFTHNLRVGPLLWSFVFYFKQPSWANLGVCANDHWIDWVGIGNRPAVLIDTRWYQGKYILVTVSGSWNSEMLWQRNIQEVLFDFVRMIRYCNQRFSNVCQLMKFKDI